MPISSATAQTDSRGRHNNPIPLWYSPSFSARLGPDSLGSYYHPSHFVRQIGDRSCGLPFAFPPTDQRGTVRLFRRRIAGFGGWRPQRQSRRLELGAEHEAGKLLRDYAEDSSCLIIGPYSPTTNTYIPSVISDRDNQETLNPGVPDFVLCTKLGLPTGSHRQSVSLIL